MTLGGRGFSATCVCRVLVWQVSDGPSAFPFSLWKIITAVPECLPGPGMSAEIPNGTGSNGCLREGSRCRGLGPDSLLRTGCNVFLWAHPTFTKPKGKKVVSITRLALFSSLLCGFCSQPLTSSRSLHLSDQH